MSHTTMATLDQAELFKLAVNASTIGDSASAIAYLKEAATRADATAVAHYLLGAEYAQIGLYERAVAGMENALALDPALSIARLQLGILLLTGGAVGRADSMLAALDELPHDEALRHFGAGLRLLIKDQLDDAVKRLGQGIALNTANAPLNDDMRNVINEIERLRAGGGAVPITNAPAPADGQHILLAAYTGKTGH
jgi:tetratricopeptide (TPR) repeat protein